MHGNDNPVKIVVVSNDFIMPDFLENMLDPQRFVLESINSNPESIAGIPKAAPDIFVVDSANSGGDVLETCRKIRDYSEMPILVLATHHKPGLVEQVLDAGADEYLIKPISGNILAAHLNTLTRRARAEKDAAASSITHVDCGRNHRSRLLTY
jgi:DNA-binding response OmpR family regulator